MLRGTAIKNRESDSTVPLCRAVLAENATMGTPISFSERVHRLPQLITGQPVALGGHNHMRRSLDARNSSNWPSLSCRRRKTGP